jgi:hypothetical protein
MADNFIRAFENKHFLRDMPLQRATFPQREPWNTVPLTFLTMKVTLCDSKAQKIMWPLKTS